MLTISTPVATNTPMVEQETLRKTIHGLKKDHGLSTLALAKELGIPQASLSRLENGQKAPSLEEIVKIFLAAGKEELLGPVIETLRPSESSKLMHGYRDKGFVPKKVETLLKDPRYTVLIMLASLSEGITIEKLNTFFGLQGIERIEHLRQEGVVVIENQQIRLANPKSISLTPESVRDVFKILVSQCSERAIEYNHAPYPVRMTSFTCNAEAYGPILYQKIKNLFDEVLKDVEEGIYSGQDPVFFGSIFEQLLPTPDQEVVQ